MNTRLSILIIACFSMISACQYSQSIKPDWEITEKDLSVVFPDRQEIYRNDETFLVDFHVRRYFATNGVNRTQVYSSNPLLLDKIYFFGYQMFEAEDSENMIGNHYVIFSKAYDGSDAEAIFVGDLIKPIGMRDVHIDDIHLLGIFENKIILELGGFLLIVDLTLGQVVFQSQYNFMGIRDPNTVMLSNYVYLGEGKIVRIKDEGLFRVLLNPDTGLYEEVLSPGSLYYLAAAVVDFIDGTVIIEDRLEANGNYDTKVLKGVSYDEGTWIDAEACQTLLDAVVPEVYNPYFSIHYTETAYQTGFLSVTHTEDQVTREFTEDNVTGLYPDIHEFYDLGYFKLGHIQGRGQNLYLSFYRDPGNLNHSFHVRGCDIFLFVYDWDNETLAYAGFFKERGGNAMFIVNPEENPSIHPEISE